MQQPRSFARKKCFAFVKFHFDCVPDSFTETITLEWQKLLNVEHKSDSSASLRCHRRDIRGTYPKKQKHISTHFYFLFGVRLQHLLISLHVFGAIPLNMGSRRAERVPACYSVRLKRVLESVIHIFMHRFSFRFFIYFLTSFNFINCDLFRAGHAKHKKQQIVIACDITCKWFHFMNDKCLWCEFTRHICHHKMGMRMAIWFYLCVWLKTNKSTINLCWPDFISVNASNKPFAFCLMITI